MENYGQLYPAYGGKEKIQNFKEKVSRAFSDATFGVKIYQSARQEDIWFSVEVMNWVRAHFLQCSHHSMAFFSQKRCLLILIWPPHFGIWLFERVDSVEKLSNFFLDSGKGMVKEWVGWKCRSSTSLEWKYGKIFISWYNSKNRYRLLKPMSLCLTTV